RFEASARVGIGWLRRTCGACACCASGRENLCERAEFTGYHADGGFADYVVVPAAFAYRIPAAFSDADAAPLLCGGIIGYRALKRADVPPGGRLGIYGFGSSAHVRLQVARARGCEVFVCTRRASHRELAHRLGATWAGGLREPMPAKTDGAIIFAPLGDVVPLALRNLARGGTLALAGIYMTPVPALEYDRDLFYERSIRSVTANTRADGEELLAEAARIPIRSAAPSLARGQTPKRGGTLSLKTWDPPHFDLHGAGGISYKIHIPLTFTHSRLLKHKAGPQVQPGTFPLEGDLAESWTQPTETTYIFK